MECTHDKGLGLLAMSQPGCCAFCKIESLTQDRDELRKVVTACAQDIASLTQERDAALLNGDGFEAVLTREIGAHDACKRQLAEARQEIERLKKQIDARDSILANLE